MKKKATQKIPLARPLLTPSAGGNIAESLSANALSQGFFNKEFENKFAKYIGVSHATTCSNGTSALWLALKAGGVGAGDEVIIPTLTFSATAAAVVAVGAVPVFVDSCKGDGNLSPKEVEKAVTVRTKAIIPVDLYGIAADYQALKVIARKHRLLIVQDAAEGLGGTYRGKAIGLQGDIGCFSFFGNKVITTGEGGMCITNSKKLYDAMVLYKNHGTSRKRMYWAEVPGFNMRMTNIHAAIGVSQLRSIKKFLQARYVIFESYMRLLSPITGVEFLPFLKRTYAPWMFTLHIKGRAKEDIVKKLQEYGIEARPGFHPLHQTPGFRKYVKKGQLFPVAEAFSQDIINLPTYVGLTKTEISYIVSSLAAILNE